MDWQPIETAPKDGTAINVTNGVGMLVLVARFVPVANRRSDEPQDEDWWRIVGDPYGGVRPSHWTPIPEPPQA